MRVGRQVVCGWTFGRSQPAMFCKWCEMAGFKHNNRGKPAVWTDAGGGCQRAKLESVKDHEGFVCLHATGKVHRTQVREWMGGWSDKGL